MHNKCLNWLRNLTKRNYSNKAGTGLGINQSIKRPAASWVAYEFGFDPRQGRDFYFFNPTAFKSSKVSMKPPAQRVRGLLQE